MFEYEVRYVPEIIASSLRHRLLSQHKDVLGMTKTFDGVTLYLPIQLPKKETVLLSKNDNDGSDVRVTVIYKRTKRMKDCIQMYNVLFDRIMKVLDYVRFSRKHFDPTAPLIIPQHKLEVWPGYVTAVDEYEGGLMLCIDVTHRVLCQTTVLEVLRQIFASSNAQKLDFTLEAKKALLGSVVITRYNNKTYRIDDVSFTETPLSTFQAKDRQVSYKEYYKAQHGIDIMDDKQPMLVNIQDRRIHGQKELEQMKYVLVPELCYLTGLTDEMRRDQKMMRDIATQTRVTPNQRVKALEQFCNRVNDEPAAREILANWGLTLNRKPIKLEARLLGVEKVTFGNGKSVSANVNADFTRESTNNRLMHVVDLNDWVMIHTRNDGRYAKAFLEYLQRVATPMGIKVSQPNIVPLNDDKTDTYIRALRSNLTKTTQIVVAICPTSRDDRYSAMKKVCCSEIPIPMQVINSRTLSNDTKNRSIVQKIALQMNCKLGGSLWSIQIPLKNIMICGIDTYHDISRKANSVSAFVASINENFTKWYSKAMIQSKKEELVHGLVHALSKALEAFKSINKQLPDTIIIYR